MAGSTDVYVPSVRDVPRSLWLAVALLVVAVAIIMHGILPRYDFRVVENGRAIIIYDRWTGRFQRANYDEGGNPTLTSVVQPF